MHKGTILLVKSNSKEDTISKAKEFLDYKNSVWDWYVIGGRWSGTLAPFAKEFFEKSKEILKSENDFISQKIVDEKQPELQLLWKSLGAEGLNPYSDHYKLSDIGGLYDIIPLKDCLPVIKEWQQTIEDAKKAEKEASERWLNRKDEDGNLYNDWNMYGYQLQCAAELYQQNFSFECNVFNIETFNFSIPEDIENYYAIMIDIHN